MIKIVLSFTALVFFAQGALAQEADTEFVVVEETASFPGGLGNFYRYVAENLKYPKDAKKMKAKGVVYVEFIVGSDGVINPDSVRALPNEFVKSQLPPGQKGDGPGSLPESCVAEAVRVIQNSPPWTPGTRKGVPVRQRMVMPIRFGG